MGGGAGVSVHGRYRLADSTLAFAMPETAIGIIPDIGASHFLPRLPGESGMYLALTGARIGRDDAMALGLATHAVEALHHDALIARLAEGEDAEMAIARFTSKPGVAALKEQRPLIDTIFAAASVEAVLERLDREGGEFAAATARGLRSRSPTALKLTYRAQRLGRGLVLKDCLKMEYRVVLKAVAAHDFPEGVRALLIDRNRPQWNPAALAAVDEKALSPYFDTLSGRELSFG
jgi:enoyl-CoA hydratase